MTFSSYHMSLFRNFWFCLKAELAGWTFKYFQSCVAEPLPWRNQIFSKGHTIKDASLVIFISESRNSCFPLEVLPITDSLYQSGCLDSFEEDREMKMLTFGSVFVSLSCVLYPCIPKELHKEKGTDVPCFLFILKFEQLACKGVKHSFVF